MELSEMPSAGSPREREMRSTFVLRLERLVHVRECFSSELNPQGLRLLNHSIKATYEDCITCGAAEEAGRIITSREYEGGAG